MLKITGTWKNNMFGFSALERAGAQPHALGWQVLQSLRGSARARSGATTDRGAAGPSPRLAWQPLQHKRPATGSVARACLGQLEPGLCTEMAFSFQKNLGFFSENRGNMYHWQAFGHLLWSQKFTEVVLPIINIIAEGTAFVTHAEKPHTAPVSQHGQRPGLPAGRRLGRPDPPGSSSWQVMRRLQVTSLPPPLLTHLPPFSFPNFGGSKSSPQSWQVLLCHAVLSCSELSCAEPF